MRQAKLTQVTRGKFRGFSYSSPKKFGVNSDNLSIYGVSGKPVGYVNKKHIDQFISGNTNKFAPVSDWVNTFSISLIQKLQIADRDEKIGGCPRKPFRPNSDIKYMAVLIF